MKKKAFTLVELIVVITILAILGTISFISLSNYSKEARDSKRTTDTSSLLSKINIEEVKGALLSDLIVDTQTGSVQILGTPDSEIQTFGKVNFNLLKEENKNFKDPRDKSRDYPAAYAIGGEGKDAYKFIQIATISEKDNKTIIKGNYYTSENGDAKSLFLTGATSQTESGAIIYENDKLPLIYDVGDGVGKDNGGDETNKEDEVEVSEMIPVPGSTNIIFADNLYAKKNEELVGVFSMSGNEYTENWNSANKCDEAKIIRISQENFDERMNGKTLEDNTIYKVKAGTYTVTGAITLGNCSAIVGEGRDNTIFQRELNNSDLDKIIYSNNNTNVVLAQLSTDGNGEASTTLPGSFAGVYFEYPKGNTTFNNMKAYNNYAEGVGNLADGEVRKALGIFFTNIGQDFNSDVVLNNIESYNNKGLKDSYVRGIEFRIPNTTYTQKNSGNLKINDIKVYNLSSENGKTDGITIGKHAHNKEESGLDGNIDISNIYIHNIDGTGLYTARTTGNIVYKNIKIYDLDLNDKIEKRNLISSRNHNGHLDIDSVEISNNKFISEKNINLNGMDIINNNGNTNVKNITINSNNISSTSTINYFGINTNNPNGNTNIQNLKIYDNKAISTKLGGSLYGINLLSESKNINLKNFSFYNNALDTKDGFSSILNRIRAKNGIASINNSAVFNNIQKHNVSVETNSNTPPRGIQVGAKKIEINNSMVFNNSLYVDKKLGSRGFIAYSLRYSNDEIIDSDVILNNVYSYNNYLEDKTTTSSYFTGIDHHANLSGSLLLNNIGIYNNLNNTEKGTGTNRSINYPSNISSVKYYGNINLFGNTVKTTSGTASGTNYPEGFEKLIGTGSEIMKDGDLQIEKAAMDCNYHIAPGGTALYGEDCVQLGSIEGLNSPINIYNTNSTKLPKQARPLRFKLLESGKIELEEYGVDGVDYNSNQMIGVF